MKKVVLGALVLVALGTALWLSSGRGSRAGELLAPASEAPAAPERVAPSIERPLETAERRELGAADPVESVPVPSVPTLEEAAAALFHARIVDALTQRPVAGARMYLCESELRFSGGSRTLEAPARSVGDSDQAGLVVVRGKDAASRRRALVVADGYGPAVLLIEPGFETPERAAWLELLPAPWLEVRAVDHAGRPQARVDVELGVTSKWLMRGDFVMSSGKAFTARGRTDADGRVVFENAPAEISFELCFLRDEKLLAAPESLALLSGERSSIERMVGTALVRGFVLDGDGHGLADVSVWVARSRPGSSVCLSSDFQATTISDSTGAFEFLALPFGSWLVGPMRAGAEWQSGESCLVDRPAVEVVLRQGRELTIEGRVLWADGLPADHAFVSAVPLDLGSTTEPLEAMSRDDGAFCFESVGIGRYEVYAQGEDGRTASEYVENGASGIELRFYPQAEISLHLSGVESTAHVWLTRIDAQGFTVAMSGARQDWTLGVIPATSVHARSGDKIGIVMNALESRAPSSSHIALELEPGATLTTVNAGNGSLGLRVSSDDCLLLHTHLLRAESDTCLVPAGAVRAELLDGERVVAAETVTLAPRERRRLVLAPE